RAGGRQGNDVVAAGGRIAQAWLGRRWRGRRERIARRRTLVARAFAEDGTQSQNQKYRDQPDQNDVVVIAHGLLPAMDPFKLHRLRLRKGQGNAAALPRGDYG